jgi:hypothetical protein
MWFSFVSQAFSKIRCGEQLASKGYTQVVWDVVAMAAVHAMAAGRKHMCSRSFAGAEKVRVQAGCARAKSAFWFTLHIFSLVHRHLPCKGWDVWVPRILSFMFLASAGPQMLGYTQLTMLLLRALNA